MYQPTLTSQPFTVSMSTLRLGCIADDFTGATDLANNLVRAGMRVIQTVGVPSSPLDASVDAVVVALKSRTVPAQEAVAGLRTAHPAALAVIFYRFGAWAWRLRVPVLREALLIVYAAGMPFVRALTGVQIQPQTRIGPGLTILHFGGVVITRECEIGPNCLLYHNVSLVTMRSRRGPRIGANFYAGVGATVIGEVTIEGFASDVNLALGVGEATVRSPESAFRSASVNVGIGEAMLVKPGSSRERAGVFGNALQWKAGKGSHLLGLSVGIGEASIYLD